MKTAAHLHHCFSVFLESAGKSGEGSKLLGIRFQNLGRLGWGPTAVPYPTNYLEFGK